MSRAANGRPELRATLSVTRCHQAPLTVHDRSSRVSASADLNNKPVPLAVDRARWYEMVSGSCEHIQTC